MNSPPAVDVSPRGSHRKPTSALFRHGPPRAATAGPDRAAPPPPPPSFQEGLEAESECVHRGRRRARWSYRGSGRERRGSSVLPTAVVTMGGTAERVRLRAARPRVARHAAKRVPSGVSKRPHHFVRVRRGGHVRGNGVLRRCHRRGCLGRGGVRYERPTASELTLGSSRERTLRRRSQLSDLGVRHTRGLTRRCAAPGRRCDLRC